MGDSDSARQGSYYGLGAMEGSARGDGNVEGRIALMNSLVPLRGKRLLDVGCGNGAYTLRMLDGFNEAVGIDIEPDRLEYFRNRAGTAAVTVLECSATEVPYGDGTFDAVTAVETMEHLGEYLSDTVREVSRVLRPEGTFYLTTPNRWWPLEQHGFMLRDEVRPGWQFPFLTWIPSIHRRFSVNDAFTPRRLDRLIEAHGFRRTGLTYMWPPFDRHPALKRFLHPVLHVLAHTPLRRFAQTLVMAYERS